MKPLKLIIATSFVFWSLLGNSQNVIEHMALDSNYLSSINNFNSISSNISNVTEYWVEDRFHGANKALFTTPNLIGSTWCVKIKEINSVSNPADSNNAININYWHAINHPTVQSTNYFEKFLIQIGHGTGSGVGSWLNNSWFYTGVILNSTKDTLQLYNIDYPGGTSTEILDIMPLNNIMINGIDTSLIWININIKIKAGTDSSKVYVNGTKQLDFTAPLNSYNSYTNSRYIRVSTNHGIFDDIKIIEGDLSLSYLDSISMLQVEDSIVQIESTPVIYGSSTDTIKFSIKLSNDSLNHDSLILADRRYYWQINNGSGWNTYNTNNPNFHFYNGIQPGTEIRCIVSGFGIDTSSTYTASYNCYDTIIEHSPLVIDIPLNSSIHIKTSDQLGLALTKKWQISNYISQGIYWSDLTNSNCQNCSGLNSDTLVLNTPAIYNGRKFRKIISGCVDDTSDVFVLNLNNSCTNSQYSLPYYYPQDSLLTGYWNFDSDSIIQDETGNHCGIMTDSMSSFINDRSSLSNSALQANGAVYFSNPFDSLKLSNEFTLNFWHRTDSIPNGNGIGYVEYMSLYNPSTWGNNGAIEIGRHWNIGLAIKQGTTPFISAPYSSTLVPNTWTMITITYKNDTVSLFMNGIEMSKTNHTLNFYDDMYLKIPNENTGITGRRLDEMTFWYRAIDSRSLRNIYEGCIINEVFQEPSGALAYTTPGIASFSLKAYEDPSTTYQWEMNSGGASWITLADNFQFNGTDKDSLFISNITAAMNNYSFRCLLNGCLSDTSSIVSLTVIDGIGIGESYNKEGSLYPNPTNGLIYIDQESRTEYFVYNLNGQLVAQGSTDSQIDITNLPAGIYQIILAINDAISIHKIHKL